MLIVIKGFLIKIRVIGITKWNKIKIIDINFIIKISHRNKKLYKSVQTINL